MKRQPKKNPMTATGCLVKMREGVAAAADMASKKTKSKKDQALIRTGGQGPDLPGGEAVEVAVVQKAYNVKLQLADASGASSGPVDLSPNDVPAYRTQMCQNRISILQTEKKKLEEKRRATTKEIERKTALRNLEAADLSFKHEEIAFVGNTIKEFRTELKHREFTMAAITSGAKAEILASTQLTGDTMRGAQREAEHRLLGVSGFDLAQRRRMNQEAERTSRVAITTTMGNLTTTRNDNGVKMREQRAKQDLYLNSLERINTTMGNLTTTRNDNGVKMREQRAKNTDAIATVAAADLTRLQTLNETVKKEQELSSTRLKMKLETTKKQMTGEYVEGRTELFNQFKKAAEVTAKMQEETAGIVEELRAKYESTRDLERQLQKI